MKKLYNKYTRISDHVKDFLLRSHKENLIDSVNIYAAITILSSIHLSAVGLQELQIEFDLSLNKR